MNSELEAKRLEVLHEFIPTATLFAELINPRNIVNAGSRTVELQASARALGLQIQILNASAEGDFETVFTTATKMRFGGLTIAPDPLFANRSDVIAALAARHAVPAISPYRAFAAAGGLMSYGNDLMDQYREVGVYVGRILKGEKPGDLPVEQATKIELVINLKAAKALGIAVPLSLSGRADEVIE